MRVSPTPRPVAEYPLVPCNVKTLYTNKQTTPRGIQDLFLFFVDSFPRRDSPQDYEQAARPPVLFISLIPGGRLHFRSLQLVLHKAWDSIMRAFGFLGHSVSDGSVLMG